MADPNALLALIERYGIEREEAAIEAHCYPLGGPAQQLHEQAAATLQQIKNALGVKGETK